MNLHVFIDSPFYVDHFIERCDRLKLTNQYHTSLVKKQTVKHIKNVNRINFVSRKELLKIIKQKEVARVYVHYLDREAIKLLKEMPVSIPVYWFFWGNDGYKHPELKENIYLPKTQEIVDNLNPRKNIKFLLDKYRNSKQKRAINKAFIRIDYCCNQVKGDFELIKSIDTSFKMKHKYFSYRGVAIPFSTSSENRQIGQKLNILLGNSANPSNNHIDALKYLFEYKDSINQVICPLSYSGSQGYINEVIRVGKEFFGERFVAILNFLPLVEYQEMLNSVDVGVFYHSRQQAYSNTVMLLEQKKPILMNPKSTLFQMYRDFEVENVHSSFEELLNSNIKDIDKLYENLGEDKIDDWYKNILNIQSN